MSMSREQWILLFMPVCSGYWEAALVADRLTIDEASYGR